MIRRDFLKAGTLTVAGLIMNPLVFWRCNRCPLSDKEVEMLFPVTQDDMKAIISRALEHGGDFADLFFEYRINSILRMEEDIMKTASRGISTGMGVRTVNGDQTGYAYSEDFGLDHLKEAAGVAARIAQSSSGRNPASTSPMSFENRYGVSEFSVDAVLKEKVSLIERANSAAHAHSSKVARVSVSLSDELKHIMYFDSHGRLFTDSQPMVMLNVYVVAEDGTLRQGASASAGGRVGLPFYHDEAQDTPESVAVEAAEIAVRNLNAKPAPAGSEVVVLGNRDSGVLLHEAVGHGLEADFNRKKLSNYSDRIGEKVASDECTIVDSGMFPNMRGSINVDDEGNLPTETVLIENGRLKGYMHDRISAKIMKAEPTGNGRRESYAFSPMPRMTNTYMKPGKYDPDEIIESTEYGVYAKRFGGGQVDITKGDFTFGVFEAYLIENGKLTYPLKDVTLIGNGPDVMRKVTMVGNDLTFTRGGWTCGKNGQSIPVGMGIPTCKISEITVGGTQSQELS